MAGRFSIDAVFKGIDLMTGATRKITKGLDKIAASSAAAMTKINAASNGAIDGLKRVGVTAAAAAAAVVAAAVTLGGAGADFEQAITNVGAVSLMTREQVADLEKEAMRLGATTKFSATEVANGMELMGKAGFDNQQILEGIGGVLAAAAADGGELAETAGHVSNVLKGMGLATSETTRVADVLALASARTNSSIGSLGESMSKVSSTARTFKIPLEDVVAGVAMLQDVGLDASEAGSAMNTMLTQMAAPTDKAKAKMKELGVSFEDANGNMLPFADVLGQLKKSADKSGGNMKQVAFFAELVGLRGQKAAMNLKDLFGTKDYQKLTEELNSAAGSAEKMANIKMDTFKGDLETLGGSVDALKIALFDTQGGALRGIVKGMTEWVDVNSEFIKSGFATLIERATPIVIAFADGIKNGFNDMKPTLLFVAGIFAFLFDTNTGPIVGASIWGERIAELAIAIFLFGVAAKVCAFAVFLWRTGVFLAARATAIYTFALRAANAMMVLWNLTTKFGIGYLFALITGTSLKTKATVTDTAATVTNTGAMATNSFMTRAAAGAKAFFALTTRSSTVALIANAGVSSMAAAAMIGFGLALAGVIASFLILNSQLEDFKKSNDGISFGEFAGEYLSNIGDGMSAKDTMDKMLNAKAKQRRKGMDDFEKTGDMSKLSPEQMQSVMNKQMMALNQQMGAGGMGAGLDTAGVDLAEQMEEMNANMKLQMESMGLGGEQPFPKGMDVGQQMSLDGASMGALENLQVTGPAEIVLPDRLARDDRMTITVKSKEGTEAEVTDAPKTKGTTVNVSESGAL